MAMAIVMAMAMGPGESSQKANKSRLGVIFPWGGFFSLVYPRDFF